MCQDRLSSFENARGRPRLNRAAELRQNDRLTFPFLPCTDRIEPYLPCRLQNCAAIPSDEQSRAFPDTEGAAGRHRIRDVNETASRTPYGFAHAFHQLPAGQCTASPTLKVEAYA